MRTIRIVSSGASAQKSRAPAVAATGAWAGPRPSSRADRPPGARGPDRAGGDPTHLRELHPLSEASVVARARRRGPLNRPALTTSTHSISKGSAMPAGRYGHGCPALARLRVRRGRCVRSRVVATRSGARDQEVAPLYPSSYQLVSVDPDRYLNGLSEGPDTFGDMLQILVRNPDGATYWSAPLTEREVRQAFKLGRIPDACLLLVDGARCVRADNLFRPGADARSNSTVRKA